MPTLYAGYPRTTISGIGVAIAAGFGTAAALYFLGYPVWAPLTAIVGFAATACVFGLAAGCCIGVTECLCKKTSQEQPLLP